MFSCFEDVSFVAVRSSVVVIRLPMGLLKQPRLLVFCLWIGVDQGLQSIVVSDFVLSGIG